MTWTATQIPRIDPNDHYSYPEIDPNVLLHMDSTTFNQWRREFDFPRIIRYLKSSLFLFETWQAEQKITDEELIFFGPARFLRKNGSLVYITESDYENQEDKKRIFIDQNKLKKYQSNPGYYGNLTILKTVSPYLDWVDKRNDKPKYLTENSILGNCGTETLNDTSKCIYNNELRTLNIGSVYGVRHINVTHDMILGSLGGWNLESKILEFLNFDFIELQNNMWHGECYLFYCSMKRAAVNSSILSYLHFYKSDLAGLKISDSTLHDVIFENSVIRSNYRAPEEITRSQLNSCKFKNSEFFRFYDYLKIRSSDFHYTQRVSVNYGEIKNLFSSAGDIYNSGKYYYLEKKNDFIEQMKLVSYIRENRIKFDEPNWVNDSLKYFAFRNIDSKTPLSKILKVKYYSIFLLFALGHYIILSKDLLNYLMRGFGEKPFRILVTFIPLILIFSLISSGLEQYASFPQLLIDNSFNMLGKFELDSSNKLNSAFRVVKAALGVFLISLFVADLSSKKKY